MIGYAILRANYNTNVPNYLDNFTPFVLSAIADFDKPIVERSEVSSRIRQLFGLNIPALVIPRLLRRANRLKLTEAVKNDKIRLTEKGRNELPDLNSEIARYRRRQAELVSQLEEFIVTSFPEHRDLTERDLGKHLAEFFDRNSVPILGASMSTDHPSHDTSFGLDFVVAAFVDHLHKTDQTRFAYVVEAAKGAMLASVLELDTSNMKDHLARLTLALDTPVVMDALGYHGDVRKSAASHLLKMATDQGAKLAIFRHSLSELEGILESIERALRGDRSSRSRTATPGYLYFAEQNASPADVAIHRERIEDALIKLKMQIVEEFGGYEHSLDEGRLEETIQSRVRYLQDSTRRNDVLSLSAVHRMRQGTQSRTLERCKAVLVSSNTSLVHGARDFNTSSTFPLAITIEEVASILWLRSTALADDVPREIVRASAYAGMQPPPTLWKKYLVEIERLEGGGAISTDDAVILRATSIGRDAFMTETLGHEKALDADLPLTVLKRVKTSIEEPLQTEVTALTDRLSAAVTKANLASNEKQRELSARHTAEREAATQREVIDDLRSEIRQLKSRECERIDRIRLNAAEFTHRWTVTLNWTLRLMAAILFVCTLWWMYSSGEYSSPLSPGHSRQ